MLKSSNKCFADHVADCCGVEDSLWGHHGRGVHSSGAAAALPAGCRPGCSSSGAHVCSRTPREDSEHWWLQQ